MKFSGPITLLVALAQCLVIDALPMPKKRGPGSITLPLKRVERAVDATGDLHPNLLLRQHLNNAYRRLARMTGSEQPSEQELTKRFIEEIDSLPRGHPVKRYTIGNTDFVPRHAADECDSDSPPPECNNSLKLNDIANDVGYFSVLELGTPPREFRLLMDSGSADFWVGGEGCQTDEEGGGGECGKSHQYLGSNSSSSFIDMGVPFEVTYGSGHVEGTKVLDDFLFGGFLLPKLQFGAALLESEDFSGDDVPFDGLMGLALSSLSELQGPTPIEALVASGLIDEPIVSYKISRRDDGKDDGEITFGALKEDQFDASTLVTLPNISPIGFWTAALDNSTVNGKDTGIGAREAILDTGTTLFIPPRAEAKKIHAMIDGSSVDEQGRYHVPCDTNATLAFTFGGQSFEIDSRDLAFAKVGDNDCLSGIGANDGDGETWLMRGLAFPANSFSDREDSHEYGTPGSNIDIPIDPALGGPQVQPDLGEVWVNGDEGNAQLQPTSQMPEGHLATTNSYMDQYDQGPQGDPFAPQPPPAFFPPETLLEEPVPPTPKPLKRKRKPKREEECGFCQGNDKNNKDGQPEQMLTCHVCGRSGWHLDCLQPPLEEPPTGRWTCPQCPAEEYEEEEMELEEQELAEDTQLLSEADREPSVASTSNPKTRSIRLSKRKKRKGRGRPPNRPPESDREEPEPEFQTPVRRGPGRPPKNATQSTRKGKGRLIRSDSEDGEEEVPSTSARQSKRLRISAPAIPRVRLRLAPQRGKGKEREEEEPKGMFDDFLCEEERETAHTSITNADILRFQRSREVSESKLVPLVSTSHPRVSEQPETPIAGPSSRPLRSSIHHQPTPSNIPSASPTVSTPGPTTSLPTEPPTLRIRSIRFGPYEIKTWYDAPFPEEYANIPDGRLWICEFCLKYMKSQFGAVRHRTKCKARHPPGDEIYRDAAVSIFEVDGRKNKIYCQNLCLLSKMYLDHKSLFYDVEPFLFYVMTEVDDVGARFVGYFSKEKRSPKDYNVSCIMTLPVRQRKGWGNLLIDFSYLLSKKEKRTGSPEKPLSGLGALGYRNYWTLSLMRYLESAPDSPLLEDISAATSMTIEDIHTTLVQQGMIYQSPATPTAVRPSPGQSIKFLRGRKSGVARRHLQRTQTNEKPTEETPKGPFVPPTHYEIRWDREKVSEYLAKWESKGYLTLKAEKLKWSPFFSNHTKKTEAMEATDTDKLMVASKLAHQGLSMPNSAPPAREATNETPLSLFDDDVVVQASPHSESKPSVDGMDLDPQPNGENGIPIANDAVIKDSNQLFTPTPEPEHVSTEPLFTPPPESRTPSVEQNGVLKDITSQKSLDDLTPLLEVPPISTPLKRPRGRPRKTSAQREQEALVDRERKKSVRPKKQVQADGTPKKRTTTRKRRMAISSSPETETVQMLEEAIPDLPDHRVNGIHSINTEQERSSGATPEVVDVKVEDLGTPSTVQYSRQSVPSDVTVFGNSGTVAEGADEPVKVNGDVPMVYPDADADADEDADADGDYDMEEEEL
ncbi:Histone acetyltransferase [Marasmius sp. AFHP31]|nr:Histone acetyltransferase [Marasmius sp. AFHP31]